MKRFAEACDRNQTPILEVLKEILPDTGKVLEIGSGTGQHAAYFSRSLPHLVWQPSDLAEALPSIEAWREESCAPNLGPPIVIDLLGNNEALSRVDAIVCINVIHIVAWAGVERLFNIAANVLNLRVYCTFMGHTVIPTARLNPATIAFDRWLKETQSRERDQGLCSCRVAGRVQRFYSGRRPVDAVEQSVDLVGSAGNGTTKRPVK